MREPPKLADTAISEALHERYGLAIAALTFLPIGNDAASSVYRVEAADGSAYFLKVRAGSGFGLPSLLVPRVLHERGVPHLLAPLPATNQELWVGARDFALSLYPFIDAQTVARAGLADDQWRALGAMVRQVHEAQLPPELVAILPREQFIPRRRSVLHDMEQAIDGQPLADPLQRELAAFWQANHAEIRAVIARADALGERMRQLEARLVPCHADMHTWNILLDTDQQLWLVDWDEVILARKERDLMFMAGGIGGDGITPHTTACFLQGYGDDAIDPVALAYYRYAWAVQDMAAYGEQVFFDADAGEETRREGVQGFMVQFEPGSIVSIARATDAGG
jgi:spectinomycin phosphotransferase